MSSTNMATIMKQDNMVIIVIIKNVDQEAQLCKKHRKIDKMKCRGWKLDFVNWEERFARWNNISGPSWVNRL